MPAHTLILGGIMTSMASITEGLSFGAGAEVGKLERTAKIDIPEERRAGFARAANVFASPDVPNTYTLPVTLPTDEAAEEFRAQVKAYAADHGLTAGLPKYIPAHRTKDVVDAKTGKITNPAHDVPANKVPKHYNQGRDVHFRFTPTRVKSPVDTKTVTVTHQAPAPSPAAVANAKSGK